LRFVCYDEKMLYREDAEPLTIHNFYKAPAKEYKSLPTLHNKSKLIQRAVNEILKAQNGNRSNTINKVCFTLGGYGDGLDEVITAISNSPQYAGEESYFIYIARYSFSQGQLKPIAA